MKSRSTSQSDHAQALRAFAFCPSPLGLFEQSLALQERGTLGAMALDMYCDMERAPYRWLPAGSVRNFARKRYVKEIDSSYVHLEPYSAAVARVGVRFMRSIEWRNRWVFFHNALFDRWASTKIPGLGNLVFGYESSSLFTFRRARSLGLPTVLYQPIGVAEFALETLGEEARRHPELADTLRYNWFPPNELDRRREERRLADAVLCASSFTKKTLVDVGVPAEKIFVEPYGVDQEMFQPSTEKHARFSIVWASSFTQTKGIGYLLEALARKPVPDAELVLAGYNAGHDPVEPYERDGRVRVRRIGKVTRDVLSGEMARSHVHVFPTLLDGFGRNIIEAMASGLPVITTPNCAGPDLIEDGVTGFIVPIRSVDALCDRLRWIHEHPQEAVAMGMRARARVAPLTRVDYRRRFAARVGEIFEHHRSQARSPRTGT